MNHLCLILIVNNGQSHLYLVCGCITTGTIKMRDCALYIQNNCVLLLYNNKFTTIKILFGYHYKLCNIYSMSI